MSSSVDIGRGALTQEVGDQPQVVGGALHSDGGRILERREADQDWAGSDPDSHTHRTRRTGQIKQDRTGSTPLYFTKPHVEKSPEELLNRLMSV